MQKPIKDFALKILYFFIDAFRIFLGPPGQCIYHVTCRAYAKTPLAKKPVYIAIPLITLRLLSCNPITALILKIFKNHHDVEQR